MLRLSLHRRGLAPRIANLPEWRAHLLERLRRQVKASADPVLAALLVELSAMQTLAAGIPAPPPAHAVIVPLELDTEHGRLSLMSTVTVFGTPVEITASELAIEAFYPADDATAERLSRLQAWR